MKPCKKKPSRRSDLDNLCCQLFIGLLAIQTVPVAFVLFLFHLPYLARILLIFNIGLAVLTGSLSLLFKRRKRIEFEQDMLMIQQRASSRLLTASDCIVRELCDHLQVMAIIGSLPGKEEFLVKYILNLADEMRLLKITGIQNPVISAVILSQKIFAREKGIDIFTSANTTFSDYETNLDLLEQIFDLSLRLLVENEIVSGSKSKFIIVDITETDTSYKIFLSVSEEAIQIFQDLAIQLILLPDALKLKQNGKESFAPVFRLISRLGATHNSQTYGNFLGELTIEINKNGYPPNK